jgi:hypothetical protein
MEADASALLEAQQLRSRYTVELDSYKAHLQQLKTDFFKRQIDKGRLAAAGDQLASLGPVAEPNNPEHEKALHNLERIVARALLDPACQGITAADTLHKKVCGCCCHLMNHFTGLSACTSQTSCQVAAHMHVHTLAAKPSHQADCQVSGCASHAAAALAVNMPFSVANVSVLHLPVQLLAGRHAADYRANMSALRQPDLSRLMYYFSQHSLLQCSLMDINGNVVLCVHSINTEALRK